MLPITETPLLMELEPQWKRALQTELQKPYIASLMAFVERERLSKIPIYPPKPLIFNAFFATPFEQVKVVIMGQDPYHGAGQAHGLCFSVPPGVAPPPSLQNIFKELASDMGIPLPKQGCLLPWAEQGVLLLNATLTVRQGEPLSHHKRGWEQFTDAVIATLAQREEPVVFVLWGRSAQDKCRFLETAELQKRHFLLKAPHPSPLSAHNGFFGSRPFSQINKILASLGKKPIDWRL
jgi:uracil-DNA glycosylase